MITIIAGSRTITDMAVLEDAIQMSKFDITEVISGRARGVDQLGEAWAKKNKVKLTIMPADWDRLGKRAGYARNVDMANYAEAAIIIWDGKSRGTKHMIDIAKAKGLKAYLRILSDGQRSSKTK